MAVISVKHKKHNMHPNSLANLHPRKPGECPNPNGRPPNEQCITPCLRDVANMKIGVKVDMRNMTFAQAAAYVHWQKAVKGDRETYEFITNRVDGKGQEKFDITTKGKALNEQRDIPPSVVDQAMEILYTVGCDSPTPGDNGTPQT